jgi:hypothetical protein
VDTRREEDEFDEAVIAGAPPNASTAASFSPDDEGPDEARESRVET